MSGVLNGPRDFSRPHGKRRVEEDPIQVELADRLFRIRSEKMGDGPQFQPGSRDSHLQRNYNILLTMIEKCRVEMRRAPTAMLPTVRIRMSGMLATKETLWEALKKEKALLAAHTDTHYQLPRITR